MDSRTIQAAQADKLRAEVKRQLDYLNKLCERMQKQHWPLEDPVFAKALDARGAIQDLYTASLGAGPHTPRKRGR
ncbi:MAG TPA: hypothetical protein VIM11_04025 [Tepidisphaeraceae bacterium]|jgi:hypothetical protein